jgi:integrase
MPSTAVRGGLYWSNRTKTWHYEARIGGEKKNGDTGCPTRVLALDFLVGLKARTAREKAGLEGPARPKAVPTLAEALERWVAAVEGAWTPKHIQDRLYTVRRHCATVLAVPLDKLDAERMDALRVQYLAGEWKGQGWRAGRKRTGGGWNRVQRHVYGIINWAIQRKMLAARPFRSQPLKIQEEVEPTLWPEDAAHFFEAVCRVAYSRDVRTAIRLMVQLGLRENEALGVRWEGFSERQGVYCPAKTKDREVREIAVPPGLMEYLKAMHGEGRRGLILGDGVGHVAGYTSNAVKRAGEMLGIDGLHPHALRSTFATAHWEAGTPLSQITAMLGHNDPQTTMGYVRQRPRDAAEAQAKVAGVMGFVK